MAEQLYVNGKPIKPGDRVAVMGRVKEVRDFGPPMNIKVDFEDLRGTGIVQCIDVSSEVLMPEAAFDSDFFDDIRAQREDARKPANT